MGGLGEDEVDPVHPVAYEDPRELEFGGWDLHDPPPAQSSLPLVQRRRGPVGYSGDEHSPDDVMIDLSHVDSGEVTDMSPWRPLPMNSDTDVRIPPRRNVIKTESRAVSQHAREFSGPPLERRLWAEQRLRPFVIKRSARLQAQKNRRGPREPSPTL
jgi:hypothetical protein